MSDIEVAVSAVIGRLKEMIPACGEQELLTLKAEIAKAKAFKKRLDSILLWELSQRPHFIRRTKHENEISREHAPNVKLQLELQSSIVGKTALTLYGNAPQPKQLFSSLQKVNVSEHLPSHHPDHVATSDGMLTEMTASTMSDVDADSIRECALPNGISTSKIIPVHSISPSKEKRKLPTLGEVFAPPISLPPLNPPSKSRHTATRSSSVNWTSMSTSPPTIRSDRREAYPLQPLSTGRWLTYNVAPSSTQLSSPEARRKQRDRALSFGEPQPAISQEAIAAHNQAKEDALFRSVYSSFAPDRDNTSAMIPDQTKSRIWWQRIGQAKYQDSLRYPDLEPLDGDLAEDGNAIETADDVEEDEFRDVVRTWTPSDLPEGLTTAKVPLSQKPESRSEFDEMLEEISDLLETLNSYQRIRNLSLANSARTVANSQLSAMTGTPSSPSAAEVDIYDTLKSRLALVVSALPPYAVSKLDGDKLQALNVSTKILIKDKNFKGSMDDDEASIRARQTATSPAVGYPPRSVNANLSVPARNTTYVHSPSTPSQSIQRPNYSNQPRSVGVSSSHLPNQQYSSRPPSSSQYFSGSTHAPQSSQRPTSATAERGSYTPSHQYNPRATTSQNQYANGYRPYSNQNGLSYGSHYSTPSHASKSASHVSQGMQSQRAGQSGYQHQSMNSPAATYNTVSSLKDTSLYTGHRAHSPQPPRPPASSSSQSQLSASHRPMYHQHVSQYGPQTPTSRPQVNGTRASQPTGQSTSQHAHTASDEQSLSMNRQKAQFVEQQKSEPKHEVGTPQLTVKNDDGQPNGTPVAQQNGVVAG